MTWLRRHQIRHYIANSLWILPVLCMAAALAVVRVLHSIEQEMGWRSDLPASTVQAVLGTMASSMFTFIVFVSSVLLVAVQLASSQLTPRIIALVFRDPITKMSLMVFVFTFTFTLAVLVRVTTSVPLLTVHLAAYSSLASLGVFLFLIDHVGKALRPSGALRAVAGLGRQVIGNVYPNLGAHGPNNATESPAYFEREAACKTVANQKDGVVLAIDIPGLVVLAQQHDTVIELLPQVGDFVASGDPLFHVYSCKVPIIEPDLLKCVAVGQERTFEQDPTFAFRILVDIACKGLSPAINDPTTAVLALDQIHHLLRDVGRRQLDDERVRDKGGRIRLVYRTPDWEDFVQLAVTEIRHFGGSSIQAARRMRGMLEDLIRTLPEERIPLLRKELASLHRSAERFFSDPEDRALAEMSDSQGVGGQAREHAGTPHLF